MIIQFSSPDIAKKKIKEVCKTLKSSWITIRPKTKEIEKKLQNILVQINVFVLIPRLLVQKWF